MDLDLMINSLPKLLNATLTTLKLLYLLLTFLSMKLINKLEIKYSRGY